MLLKVKQYTFTLFFSSDPSVMRQALSPSVPSTLRKQLVVWPIPLGRTLSHNMALITELFPLLVLKNEYTKSWQNIMIKILFFHWVKGQLFQNANFVQKFHQIPFFMKVDNLIYINISNVHFRKTKRRKTNPTFPIKLSSLTLFIFLAF